MPGNTTTADPVDNFPAVITIAQRPILPEFTPLAAAATAVQQSAWDRNTKILKHIQENYDALKLRLINSVAVDDIAILRDPTTAFLNVTPQAILEHIATLHGRLDNNDYAQLISTLQTAMTPTDRHRSSPSSHPRAISYFQSGIFRIPKMLLLLKCCQPSAAHPVGL